MSSQFEMKYDGEITSDTFDDPRHAVNSYTTILTEYEQKLIPMYNHIVKAKTQMPPYWDDKSNSPEKMPMYQHNVSSGRFKQTMTQVSLPYNSFFPNKAYSQSLIEVKMQNYPYQYIPGRDT